MLTTRPEWLPEIDGADALFSWFGYWPSFHDAEIISVELNHRDTSSLRIHTWEMTNEVDNKGHYRSRKHVLAHFLLEGISDLDLTGFSAQNVISELKISRSQDAFRLELCPCYGLAGSLTAAKLQIQIEPGITGTE